MGIPCDGPAYILGDNQSVLCNTTISSSTLKKKCQSIAYILIRERVARDEQRTVYIKSDDNDSDLLTKKLPSGEMRKDRSTSATSMSVCEVNKWIMSKDTNLSFFVL